MEQYVKIRRACPEDAKELLKIYERYVEETAVTFEYDVPDIKEFKERIMHISEDLPYLVCELEGEIVGYAYASHYRARTAFMWDCELSIYINDEVHRSGIGTLLYTTLLKILKEMNYVHAYACITTPNNQSVGFHESMGFEKIGFFPKCGFKQNQWHDITWMDLNLQDSYGKPEKIKKIGDISEAFIRQVFEESIQSYNERLHNDMKICEEFIGLLGL